MYTGLEIEIGPSDEPNPDAWCWSRTLALDEEGYLYWKYIKVANQEFSD